MGGNDQRTDYMPEEEFVRRRHEAKVRGDIWMKTSGELLVPFDSDFDKFVANVAYAIRGLVVYRSDGGVFARGLVRASGHLKMYHDAQIAATPPTNGITIRLIALFYRRKDPRANMRWMMQVKFVFPDWIDEEPEAIVASQEATDSGWEKAMRTVLDCAALEDQDFTGPQGDQIRAMVAIAERVGYPRNWNLWYYNRSVVFRFVKWGTNDADRDGLIKANGGALPYDGETAYPHAEWRIYPFRELAQQYGTLDHGHCSREIHNLLETHQDTIQRTVDDIQREIDRAGMAFSYAQGYNFAGTPNSRYATLVSAFLENLQTLVNDPDHLYSAFK
jgi:hypothetical protein